MFGCDECGGKTVVIDNADVEEGTMYRIRKCTKCGRKFFTEEFTCLDDEMARLAFARTRERYRREAKK